MYYWFWCLLLITIILSNDIKKLVVTFVSVFCCHGWSWVPYMEDWSLHADHLQGEACYDVAHIKLIGIIIIIIIIITSHADHLQGEACYDAAHIKLVGEVEELGESCKLLAEKVHFAFKLGIPGIRCHWKRKTLNVKKINQQLDPVGSTVRYEMRSCVLGQYRTLWGSSSW